MQYHKCRVCGTPLTLDLSRRLGLCDDHWGRSPDMPQSPPVSPFVQRAMSGTVPPSAHGARAFVR
jgi:hypothetical protein